MSTDRSKYLTYQTLCRVTASTPNEHKVGVASMTYVHTKLNENQSAGSKIKRGYTYTQCKKQNHKPTFSLKL
jgi:hypothetical protein